MRSTKCLGCGTSLLLFRSDAKTCSATCRKRVSRQQIPAALAEVPRWVRWKPVRRRGVLTKVPVQLNGQYASSTNSCTWTTFKHAKESSIGTGMGFVLTGDGIACIDLDHCLVDGVPTPAAQAFLDRFPHAWVERSPSGDGLHIWGIAEDQPGRRTSIDGLNVEFYTSGRYITVTGKTFRRGSVDVPLSL